MLQNNLDPETPSVRTSSSSTAAPETVDSIEIVLDEGQDTGPDNFGLAVVDNIDVNGTLVGAGQNGRGKNNGHGDNEHNGNNGDDDQGDD